MHSQQAEEYNKPFTYQDDADGKENTNGEAVEENKNWRPKVDKCYPFSTVRTMTANHKTYFEESKPLCFRFYAHVGGKKVWTCQSSASATYV